ncbi:hypothetical protein [Actinokineospora sp.]|uniref:hypothetical protein n=1 Tax=Actinokineospora sp. TaxID=1872133 RepID=UPI003D6A3059
MWYLVVYWQFAYTPHTVRLPSNPMYAKWLRYEIRFGGVTSARISASSSSAKSGSKSTVGSPKSSDVM